jgi:hypothetical protein
MPTHNHISCGHSGYRSEIVEIDVSGGVDMRMALPIDLDERFESRIRPDAWRDTVCDCGSLAALLDRALDRGSVYAFSHPDSRERGDRSRRTRRLAPTAALYREPGSHLIRGDFDRVSRIGTRGDLKLRRFALADERNRDIHGVRIEQARSEASFCRTCSQPIRIDVHSTRGRATAEL